MAALKLDPPPKNIALALSGGGDSIALMHLLRAWRGKRRISLSALIVDHRLRDDSPAEAKKTADWARASGWGAEILTWPGKKPRGNVEEAAREARYALLGSWCAAHAVRHLFVAHSQDDLAETFLLRLGRGSGVDGLSAMRACAPFPIPGFPDTALLRPLLGFERSELRAYLASIGANWLEDPMNEDPSFARVRVRALLPALREAGIPPKRIADAARHLSRAREALEAAAETFLGTHSSAGVGGALFLDAAALCSAPREIGLRVLAELLKKVAGASYRPRFERLEALYESLAAAGAGTKFAARTLHGCRIGAAAKKHHVFGATTIEIKKAPERKAYGLQGLPK